MFNHLLQIASFKSGPQHFSTPIWALVVFVLLFTGVQGYALSLSPENELIRMFVASFIKMLVIGAVLTSWMKSIDRSSYAMSTFMMIVFISLLAEVVKLPLTTMIRDAKLTSDVTTALILSIPLIGVVIWQYTVWFYGMKQVAQRSKGEILAVMVSMVLVSEVVGFVLSKIGSPIEGF